MKTLPINHIEAGKKLVKPIKKAAPFVASAMLAATALVAGSKAKTAKEESSVPAAIALATMLPAGVKRKKNEVEMLSNEFIQVRKGKYLSEEEIQAYKDKWNKLNSENLITQKNKYIAHTLCHNPKIDEKTAINCLKKIANFADEHFGLNDSPKKVTRNCQIIINSDKIKNENLPDILSTVRGNMQECYIDSFLEDTDFIIENIRSDCYKYFMDSHYEQEKLDPGNYKQEKVTDEMISKFESFKKGRSEARRLIRSKDSVQKNIRSITIGYERHIYKTNGYEMHIEDELNKLKKEIKTYKNYGLNMSEIAQKLNISEDCVNALEYLLPNDIY